MMMFNIDNFKLELDDMNVVLPQLTKQQLNELFISESLMNIRRRSLGTVPQEQSQYNRDVATILVKHPSPYHAILNLLNCIKESNDGISKETQFEMCLFFMSIFVGAMVRAAYRIDGLVKQANGGVIDILQKNHAGIRYTGPVRAYILSDTIRDTINNIVSQFSDLYNNFITCCCVTFKRSYPRLQLGGIYDITTGIWEPHLSVDDAWGAFTPSTPALGWEGPRSQHKQAQIAIALAMLRDSQSKD